MDRRAWTLLIVLGAIWGSSYLFIKIGIRDMSPGMVAWARCALGAVVIAAIALPRGAFAGVRERIPVLILVGVIQVAGPFLLIAAGEQEISSSLAGILVSAAPLWTAVLAVWVDQEERSSGLRLAGVVLGFVGVGVLLGVDLGGSEFIGGLAVVIAALGYAIGGFMVKRQLSDVQPVGVAASVLVVSAIALLPVAAIGAPDATPGLGPLAAVAALGAVGTGVAFVIFYDLIATIGPARAFIVTYLAPGFAVIYGATFLDESIGVATLAGLALILAGSYLAAEGRLPARLERLRAAPADNSA
jgi:drug/metabolite transporter (DMT)-like permease